jgi:hypothetical protein
MGEARRSTDKKPARPKPPAKASTGGARVGGAARKTGAKGKAASTAAKGKARAGRKTAPPPTAAAVRARARRPRKPAPLVRGATPYPGVSRGDVPEEERIESAKYLAPSSPRVFEEERFVFPETYGVNRVRLLVKDPDWLFAHWDVNPTALAALEAEVGLRTLELSKVTLKVFDPVNGGSTVMLVPAGVRSWYIRADTVRRAYRAELGLTLPSGEYRVLAESNTVVTPRVGPSQERARLVVSYRKGRAMAGRRRLSAAEEDIRSVSRAPGPWKPVADRLVPGAPDDPSAPNGVRAGASDSFRPGGASDVHRR